jgi:hypothetical protein
MSAVFLCNKTTDIFRVSKASQVCKEGYEEDGTFKRGEHCKKETTNNSF